MLRLLRNVLLLLLLGAAVAAGFLLLRSPDPYYSAHEWVARPAYWAYDDLIATAAKKHGVDPMLLKAVVWRESRFHPGKRGGAGERGLMQVTEGAARDWAKAEKLETFVPADLFDPHNNLEAGAWYLSKALEHWKAQDDPVPFALAEYNAGRRRVERWMGLANRDGKTSAAEFLTVMDFPGTRQYIEDVTERWRFYQKRGRL
jgi:soluble lytic murein transglycosylase